MAVDLDAVRRVLEATWDGPVRLGEPEPLWRREHVVRVPVLSPDDETATVVVKVPRSDEAVASFVAEMAAVSIVGSGEQPVSARYLASADDPLLLVMEDVGGGPTLADLLLAADRGAAEKALLQYAGGLADLHAAGFANADEFARRTRALGHDPTRSATGRFPHRRTQWREQLARLGVDGRRATSDLDRIERALVDPGPFHGIVHGDACPDNVRFVDGRLRVFDFEWASVGNVLLDGVYPLVPFPTCWCVGDLPIDLADRAATAYRTRLAAAAALDTSAIERGMVVAWAAWLVSTTPTLLTTIADSGDADWGLTTFAARVAGRLARFAAHPLAARELPGLVSVVTALHGRVAGDWPDRDTTLPAYPAFARAGDRVAIAPEWWFEGA